MGKSIAFGWYGGKYSHLDWLLPPTRMDESQLKAEGMYAIFDAAGARTEMPGCSLCMGNQSLHCRQCHGLLDIYPQFQ
jgi:aconitase B